MGGMCAFPKAKASGRWMARAQRKAQATTTFGIFLFLLRISSFFLLVLLLVDIYTQIFVYNIFILNIIKFIINNIYTNIIF